MNMELIKAEISVLKIQYQAEMADQNNKSSLERSYAGADRIAAQIDNLREQLD